MMYAYLSLFILERLANKLLGYQPSGLHELSSQIVLLEWFRVRRSRVMQR